MSGLPDSNPSNRRDDELDGWALWQEHRPQTAEDWVAVAERCAADPDFDHLQSSPIFGAAVLLARRVRAETDRARELAAHDGRLLARLDCGCEIFDVAGYAVVVGADCDLDHYRDVERAIEDDDR